MTRPTIPDDVRHELEVLSKQLNSSLVIQEYPYLVRMDLSVCSPIGFDVATLSASTPTEVRRMARAVVELAYKSIAKFALEQAELMAKENVQ